MNENEFQKYLSELAPLTGEIIGHEDEVIYALEAVVKYLQVQDPNLFTTGAAL